MILVRHIETVWPSRRDVLWIGPVPDERTRRDFETRNLKIKSIAANDPKAFNALKDARAAVFCFDHSQPKVVKFHLQQTAAAAAKSGVALFYNGIDDIGDGYFYEQIKPSLSDGLHAAITIRRTGTAEDIPELIARLLPGPSPNEKMKFDFSDPSIDFDEEQELLLRRAFSDCSRLFVRKMNAGRSGALVLQVHATMDDSLHSRPMPFLAKIDASDKAIQEYSNYVRFADQFIPFNLRPNLDVARCLHGLEKAILVGNFVEGAEPISRVVQRGTALTPVHSLFENTLRGWRHAAEAVGIQTDGNIAVDLKPLFRRDFSAGRIAAAKAKGALHSPDELHDMLFQLPEQRHLRGRIHGDLNTGNVLVRVADAVLIDFAKTGFGPLVADPAAFEVSVVFGPPEKSIESIEADDRAWSALVDKLYDPATFRRIPEPAVEPLEGDWLWNTVRQIRLSATVGGGLAGAYFIALCCFMLRYASHPGSNVAEEFRRTYAYVIADRLIPRLSQLLTQQ